MHATIPSARFGIATFGELVSDPSRVAMLLSLMDGLARPASELASLAGVAASTASSHLGRLLRGGLVRAERQGRHRYFRLASEPVADALEVIALQAAPGQRLAPSNPARAALSHARTCYQHLAGRLGVAWLAALESQRLLRIHDGALTLAPRGVVRFERLGLAMAQWPAGRPCLDWTERRNHLGGPLGTLLTGVADALKRLEPARDFRGMRPRHRMTAAADVPAGAGEPRARATSAEAASSLHPHGSGMLVVQAVVGVRRTRHGG